MLKTLVKVKKFGKKLPRGITPPMRRFSGKTIPVHPVVIGVIYMHISGKKTYFFAPPHLEGVTHE